MKDIYENYPELRDIKNRVKVYKLALSYYIYKNSCESAKLNFRLKYICIELMFASRLLFKYDDISEEDIKLLFPEFYEMKPLKDIFEENSAWFGKWAGKGYVFQNYLRMIVLITLIKKHS